MDNIVIYYWHGSKLPNLEWLHQDMMPYTRKKLHDIVDTVLDAGYNVQISQHDETVVVSIATGKFTQR